MLSSGSLYLSPPLPDARGLDLVQKIETQLKHSGLGTLHSASASDLIATLTEMHINSMWLQVTPELENWEDKTGQAEEILVGDVDYEVSSLCLKFYSEFLLKTYIYSQ